MRLRLILKLHFVMLLLFILATQSFAYTTTDGIETGDVVNLDYTLSYDGEVQQQGPNFQTAVTDQALIVGFYEGLLGMKVGEDKEIVVTPDKGYTDPEHELYGKTLYFDVYINGIVESVRGDEETGTDGGIGTTLKKIGNAIMVLGGLTIGVFALQSVKNRATIPKCEHCSSIGKSTLSEGYCKSCGLYYCRGSFIKGCPNCNSNTFNPL